MTWKRDREASTAARSPHLRVLMIPVVHKTDLSPLRGSKSNLAVNSPQIPQQVCKLAAFKLSIFDSWSTRLAA